MAQAYLFVHFREKTTPDGEQVYFGISAMVSTGKPSTTALLFSGRIMEIRVYATYYHSQHRNREILYFRH